MVSERRKRVLARLDNMTLPLQVSAINAKPVTTHFDQLSEAERERFRSFEDPDGALARELNQ